MFESAVNVRIGRALINADARSVVFGERHSSTGILDVARDNANVSKEAAIAYVAHPKEFNYEKQISRLSCIYFFGSTTMMNVYISGGIQL